MRSSDLPNLRGVVVNAGPLKAELARAINHAVVMAKRGDGTSNAAAVLDELFDACKAEVAAYQPAP